MSECSTDGSDRVVYCVCQCVCVFQRATTGQRDFTFQLKQYPLMLFVTKKGIFENTAVTGFCDVINCTL